MQLPRLPALPHGWELSKCEGAAACCAPALLRDGRMPWLHNQCPTFAAVGHSESLACLVSRMLASELSKRAVSPLHLLNSRTHPSGKLWCCKTVQGELRDAMTCPAETSMCLPSTAGTMWTHQSFLAPPSQHPCRASFQPPTYALNLGCHTAQRALCYARCCQCLPTPS